MKISFTIQDRVLMLLCDFPELRDNTFKLCTKIWREDYQTITGKLFVDFEEFATLFEQGKLTHTESIRRYSQMIQERNPVLRGKMWKERHRYAEKVSDHLKEVAA